MHRATLVTVWTLVSIGARFTPGSRSTCAAHPHTAICAACYQWHSHDPVFRRTYNNSVGKASRSNDEPRQCQIIQAPMRGLHSVAHLSSLALHPCFILSRYPIPLNLQLNKGTTAGQWLTHQFFTLHLISFLTRSAFGLESPGAARKAWESCSC